MVKVEVVENDVVDVLDKVDVDVDVVVLVLDEVDDVVVETEVVALDVMVDVCVVDGDVISQPWNVPENCSMTTSFSASAKRVRRDSLVPRMSSFLSTSRIMCTLPLKSMRHPTSKILPPAFPRSKSVTSFVNAASPIAVNVRHEVVLPDMSIKLYRCGEPTAPPSAAQPSWFAEKALQSGRAKIVLSAET